jgi:nicotinamidase-related amidase
VHELLRGTGWTAVVFGGTTSAAGAAAAARRLRDSGLNTVLISTDCTGTAQDRSALAHRAYRAADGAVYLIRPDGHAARSAGSATDRVLRHARSMQATGGD